MLAVLLIWEEFLHLSREISCIVRNAGSERQQGDTPMYEKKQGMETERERDGKSRKQRCN